MKLQDQINQLQKEYTVLSVTNLNDLSADFLVAKSWLDTHCRALHQTEFQPYERIVFTITEELYDKQIAGIRLRTLQRTINEIDITNCFICIVSTNPDLKQEIEYLKSISSDQTMFEYYQVDGNYIKNLETTDNGLKFEGYRYGSPEPTQITLHELDERKQFFLAKSKVFCIYPWIHLHAHPTGDAYPCCHAEMNHSVGSCKNNSLEEIWNSSGMKNLRVNMLNEKKSDVCADCYEQEKHGFFSGRNSANKHHGHQIDRIDQTASDGVYDEFKLTYWDIRFSNLCNLRCRSCGDIFSSSWFQDQVQLAGPEWAKTHRALNYAGRTETDIWEQLIPHLDYVEQIYFAGGEPLMMAEHYNILDELERRGRFDVRLIYNTNFTQTKLKDREVFDYWRKFDSVSVGASLDDMGPRAEYIRKGTNWDSVERNREMMMKMCPDVDFYISPTLSILNAMSLPKFHRDWTERGFIKARDLNVNLLTGPVHYRIDIATPLYKEKLQHLYQEHLEWLRPQDSLKRATVGYESAIKFMMSTDNSQLLPKFWEKTEQLDAIRNENVLDVIPELKDIK
jgi:radical SAM protein with 4Fe4S-binding SPASM domain